MRWTAVAVLLLLAGCRHSGAPDSQLQNELNVNDEQNSAALQAQAVLGEHCAGCHGPDGDEPANITDIQALIDNGYLADSGDADDSIIWNVIAGTGGYEPDYMPMGEPLPAAARTTLQTWLSQGAIVPKTPEQTAEEQKKEEERRDKTYALIQLDFEVNAEPAMKPSCMDCHSFETQYNPEVYIPWIGPKILKMMAKHVEDGQKALLIHGDFPWDPKIRGDIPTMIGRLKAIKSSIKDGSMPLSVYVTRHYFEGATVTAAEQKKIFGWVDRSVLRLRALQQPLAE